MIYISVPVQLMANNWQRLGTKETKCRSKCTLTFLSLYLQEGSGRLRRVGGNIISSKSAGSSYQELSAVSGASWCIFFFLGAVNLTFRMHMWSLMSTPPNFLLQFRQMFMQLVKWRCRYQLEGNFLEQRLHVFGFTSGPEQYPWIWRFNASFLVKVALLHFGQS